MGRNKKSVGLLKDKFGGQVMKEFVGLRPKTYSHLKKKKNFKIIKIA